MKKINNTRLGRSSGHGIDRWLLPFLLLLACFVFVPLVSCGPVRLAWTAENASTCAVPFVCSCHVTTRRDLLLKPSGTGSHPQAQCVSTDSAIAVQLPLAIHGRCPEFAGGFVYMFLPRTRNASDGRKLQLSFVS
jgi:hypothetical protein